MSMGAVEAFCDRCGNIIRGFEVKNEDGVVIGTCGFYYMTNSVWEHYRTGDEAVICDQCMRADQRYQADYEEMLKQDEP